jgi:hypothetical protein
MVDTFSFNYSDYTGDAVKITRDTLVNLIIISKN